MNAVVKILIIDDVETNIELLTAVLSEDFDVKSVDSGEKGLALIGEFKPDVLLLDIMMPGINGYEVCQELRKKPEFKNLKIIMMSGHATEKDINKGMEYGAYDYLAKPFDVLELRDSLLEMNHE